MSTIEFQGKTVDAISDFDRRVFESISKGQWLPNAFKQYIVEYLALNQPLVPVGQLVGFSQFTAQVAAAVDTQEQTNSTTYVNLTTTGPTLTGLPDGQYLVLFGAAAEIDTATVNSARMSLEVNGVAAADTDMALSGSQFLVSVSRVVTKTFAAGSNTITAKYRSTNAGTNAIFANRWMILLRYAN